jgi:DNA polymerase III subunit chi
MTRIDFYSLAEDSSGDRLLLTCRLAQRAYGEGLKVSIATADARTAREVDRLLWTFRDDSFLPHGLVGETDPELTPILIGVAGEMVADVGGQVLINLDLDVPAALDRYERLLEPIDLDPQVRAAGRRRYVHYKGLGYPLEHREIRL